MKNEHFQTMYIKRMMRSFLTFLIILSFVPGSGQTNTQKKIPARVRITFVEEEGDQAKTFIGQLKGGDKGTLKWEMKRYDGGLPSAENDPLSKQSVEGYVEKITLSGREKTDPEKREEKARNDLLGNYPVDDEKSLKKIDEKKQKARDQKYTSEGEKGNFQKYQAERRRKPVTTLSKFYRVSARRIRNGQTFRKPAGDVSFIVTYKIREGRYVNTYMNIVEGYLNPGSDYLLKYHGLGARRTYYLEYTHH